MKFFSVIMVIILFCFNNINASEFHSEPVIKIRLNSQNISYEKKLTKVVDKIFEVNSKAKIILVSVMKTGSKESDKVFVNKKIKEIAKKLHECGVHEKNIEYKTRLDKSLVNDEIHILLSV